MGLDMYLTRKTYVSRRDWIEGSEQFDVSVKQGGKPYPHIDPANVSYVIEHVGYWRKANAIHNWFVEHCGNGNDNCEEYYVSPRKLQDLLNAVNEVLASLETVACPVANGMTMYPDGKVEYHTADGEIVVDTSVCERLLPRKAGFFFGGQEYDSYYIQDLHATKRIVESVLATTGEDQDLYYQASW